MSKAKIQMTTRESLSKAIVATQAAVMRNIAQVAVANDAITTANQLAAAAKRDFAVSNSDEDYQRLQHAQQQAERAMARRDGLLELSPQLCSQQKQAQAAYRNMQLAKVMFGGSCSTPKGAHDVAMALLNIRRVDYGGTMAQWRPGDAHGVWAVIVDSVDHMDADELDAALQGLLVITHAVGAPIRNLSKQRAIFLLANPVPPQEAQQCTVALLQQLSERGLGFVPAVRPLALPAMAVDRPRQAHVRQLRGKPIQPGQPLLFDAKPTRRKARAPGPSQPSDETGPAAPQTCLSYKLQNGASQ